MTLDQESRLSNVEQRLSSLDQNLKKILEGLGIQEKTSEAKPKPKPPLYVFEEEVDAAIKDAVDMFLDIDNDRPYITRSALYKRCFARNAEMKYGPNQRKWKDEVMAHLLKEGFLAPPENQKNTSLVVPSMAAILRWKELRAKEPEKETEPFRAAYKNGQELSANSPQTS